MNNIKIFGVAGFPVLHSKSPEMFNTLLENQNCIYTRFSSDKPEELVLMNLIEEKNHSIISIGGGAVLSKKNRELLKKKTLNIWLWSSMGKTGSRLKAGFRPLIKKPSDIHKIFSNRIGYYGEVADIVIPNLDNLETNTAKIIKELKWG